MFESRRQNKNNCEVQTTFVSTEKSRNESLKIATAAAGGRDVSGSTRHNQLRGRIITWRRDRSDDLHTAAGNDVDQGTGQISLLKS